MATASMLTSSRTGTLYFAYGSNLSAHQMQYRCTDSPATSALPIAVARLDGWKWIICERGYANIVPLGRDTQDAGGGVSQIAGGSASAQTGGEAGGVADEDASVVWGVLYNMTPGDERVLDEYEGHNKGRNPLPEVNPDPGTRGRMPELQGGWDYNKWYIAVTVMKWLQPPSVLGLDGDPRHVGVMAYVDELRIEEGAILKHYVGRMNRAIEEGVKLGVPRAWVDKVMRKWVVPGIFPEHGYVGTNEGYVPENEPGASTEVV